MSRDFEATFSDALELLIVFVEDFPRFHCVENVIGNTVLLLLSIVASLSD
jgi:hypothetical protein